MARAEKVPQRGKGIRALARVSGVERNQAEFTEFYESARDDCLRVVLVTVGDRTLAEDLVAEAFTRAWTSWRTVRKHPAPHAWVMRTALNAHVSWWRRRNREMTLEGHDLPDPGGRDAVLDRSVLAALRRLPVRQRQVIVLRLLLDLDSEATARVLQISPGTVGVHLHRAIQALRGDVAFANGQPPLPSPPGGPGRAPLRRMSLAEMGDRE